MKFHLDENVPHAIAHGLRLRGIDVTTSTDVGLVSATDPEQLQFALSENRVIITHDQDMLRLAAQGVPHAGIVYWPNFSKKIGYAVNKLYQLHVDDSDLRNDIRYL